MTRHLLLGLVLAACGDDIAAGGSSETGDPPPPPPPACTPGETRSCYSGPAGSDAVAPCHSGTQTCTPAGDAWGTCEDEITPAPADCDIVGDETCGTGSLCPGEPIWARNFRGTTQWADWETAAVWGMTVDGDGDLYLLGGFLEVLDLDGPVVEGTTGFDVFLARFDPTGEMRWIRQFAGDYHSPSAGSLLRRPDGDLVFTTFCAEAVDFGAGPVSGELGDFAVAQFSPDGDLRWTRRFVGLRDNMALATGREGRLWLAGGLDGVVDLGAGPVAHPGHADVLLVELGDGGALVQSAHFGDLGYQTATALTIASDGDLIVTGNFEGSLDFGDGPLHGGGYVDLFLTRLAPDLTPRWALGFPALGSQSASGVAVHTDDQVTLVGNYTTAFDLGGGPLPELWAPDLIGWSTDTQGFIARFDGDGAHVWSRPLGITQRLDVEHLDLGAADRLLLSGQVFGPRADVGGGTWLGADAGTFLTHLDPEGVPRYSWVLARRAVNPGWSPVHAVTSPLGQVVVAISDLGRTQLAGIDVGADHRDTIVLAGFAP